MATRKTGKTPALKPTTGKNAAVKAKTGKTGSTPALKPSQAEPELSPDMRAKLKALGIPVKAWPPNEIEAVVRGHKTLGELAGVSKQRQFEMAATGLKLLKDGLVDKATEIFQGLEALDPFDAYVQVCLGTIAAEDNDFANAEARFTRALSFNPYSVPALASRGEVRLRQGKVKEGRADLEAAVREDPKGKQETTARAKALLAAMK